MCVYAALLKGEESCSYKDLFLCLYLGLQQHSVSTQGWLTNRAGNRPKAPDTGLLSSVYGNLQ